MMKTRSMFGWNALAAMIACIAVASSHAQSFPVKPLRMVVPFAPGGGTDVIARRLGSAVASLRAVSPAADFVLDGLRHPDEVDRLRINVGEYVSISEANLAEYRRVRAELADTETLPIDTGSTEYAPQVIHSLQTGTTRVISANVVNALFNWVFIFGHWGSPAYGVAGSGWSTCLARTYMALVMWIAVLRFQRDHPVSERVRVEFARVRGLLRLGFPAAMQILMEIVRE